MRFSKDLKPCSSKNGRRGPSGMGRRTMSSKAMGSGQSSFRVTKTLDKRAISTFSIRLSRIFDGFISAAAASTDSRSPYSEINLVAVFGPIPGTPGTLSDESPIKAKTSPTSSGPTPNFSMTSSRFMRLSFIVSNISTPFPTNCIRSLSDEIMVTCQPSACAATV